MFFRRRRAFAYGAGWLLVLSVAALMLCPPYFTSTAKILVQQDRAQVPVSPGLQGFQQSPPPEPDLPIQEQDVNSEVELLTSSYLIEQTLAGLKPADSGVGQKVIGFAFTVLNLPAYFYSILHGTRQPTDEQIWAAKVASHLSVKVVKRSNVIEISFTSHNAAWSHDFLARLLDEYLTLRAAISHDPAAQTFFHQQAKLLKAKLTRDQDDLRNVRLQTGITDLRAQQHSLIDQLTSARADYRRNEGSLVGNQEQIDYLNRQLASYPEHIDSETTVVQNYALQTLKPQLLQLEAERAELLTRYRPDSERLRSIDAKLKTARELVQREETRQVKSTRNTLNPTWLTLANKLAQAKVSVASLQASQSDLAGLIANYEKQLQALTSAGLEVERLEQQVTIDRDIYLSYLRKDVEARAAKALNLNKILNVSLDTPPSLPLKPVFPKIPIDVYAVIFVACAFGLIIGYWSEARDERIFSSAMIAAVSGLPTVAILNTRHD